MESKLRFVEWARQGRMSPYVTSIKSSSKFLGVVDGFYPASDISGPPCRDLILAQNLGTDCAPISGDYGSGKFKATINPRSLSVVAPNYANTVLVGGPIHCRAFSLNSDAWRNFVDDGGSNLYSFDFGHLHKGLIESHNLSSMLRKLHGLMSDEGEVSLLLSQAAGIEILVELRRLAGTPVTPARGGLSSLAERRCLELLHGQLAEDISVEQPAIEARLSPFHFTRMFKKSVGMSPRAYLVHLRVQKACARVAPIAVKRSCRKQSRTRVLGRPGTRAARTLLRRRGMAGATSLSCGSAPLMRSTKESRCAGCCTGRYRHRPAS